MIQVTPMRAVGVTCIITLTASMIYGTSYRAP